MRINMAGKDSSRRPSQAFSPRHSCGTKAGQDAGLYNGRADHKPKACSFLQRHGRTHPVLWDGQTWGPWGNKAWRLNTVSLLSSASYEGRQERLGKFLFENKTLRLNQRLSKWWRGLIKLFLTKTMKTREFNLEIRGMWRLRGRVLAEWLEGILRLIWDMLQRQGEAGKQETGTLWPPSCSGWGTWENHLSWWGDSS